ncbi:MAG: hypothetical protein ABSH47_04095 [Bryobacteraceae bacterium]|jgi:hypothetical protein
MRLLARLDNADVDGGRDRIFEYALCLAFLLPLLFGVFSAVKSQRMTLESNGLAHDLARMCRQGVDFSTPANRGVALELARGRGLTLGGDSGMAILSRVRVVQDAGCNHCANAGLAVFDQQIVIGTGALRHSQTGTPPSDAGTGLVRDSADNPAARARVSDEEVRPGMPAWICELWFAAPDQPDGIYVRVAD